MIQDLNHALKTLLLKKILRNKSVTNWNHKYFMIIKRDNYMLLTQTVQKKKLMINSIISKRTLKA